MSWTVLLFAFLLLGWLTVFVPVLLARAVAAEKDVRVRVHSFPAPRIEIEVTSSAGQRQ
ncbi:hypothetical protein [Crossiella sp. NPDC003009]